MRYNSINSCECVNGLGWGVSLFTQGCYIKCKNCFNKETWDYNKGKEYTDKEINKIRKIFSPDYITRFSILGGEPLSKVNYYYLDKTIQIIKENKPNIKIWLYSGREYEDIIEEINISEINYLKNILDNTDVLVCGPFIQEEKDLTLAFRGSRNQRIIDLNKTRQNNSLTLLDI